MRKTETLKGAKIALAAVVVLALAFVPLLMGGCSSGQTAASSSSSSASSSSASTAGEQIEPSTEGDMKIPVTLTEDVAGADLQETALQFSEETLDVNCPVGSTALEVLKACGREIATAETAAGTEVTAIGGLANGDAGEGSHWTYDVNGAEQSVAPSACTLQEGDQLTFRFVAGA